MPDRYTLHGLLHVCSACEDEDAAELAMVELESKGVPRSTVIEARLLLQAKLGNVAEVLTIYSEMQKEGRPATPEVLEVHSPKLPSTPHPYRPLLALSFTPLPPPHTHGDAAGATRIQ